MFQVQIRKDGVGVCDARVRIEYPGVSAEGVTGDDGFITFEHSPTEPVTIYLDGQRRGTYDPGEVQSVTIML